MVGAESGHRTRGQLILIGAITLAFIVLGVVVVFNGVLYTEEVTSGGAGERTTDVAIGDAEVEQGVGCLLEQRNADSDANATVDDVETDVDAFAELYRDARSQSTPVVAGIEFVDATIDESEDEVTSVEVRLTTVSHDVDHERVRTIEAGCPGEDRT